MDKGILYSMVQVTGSVISGYNAFDGKECAISISSISLA
jgi:hypothetical protein